MKISTPANFVIKDEKEKIGNRFDHSYRANQIKNINKNQS